jgi:hypothetical protein
MLRQHQQHQKTQQSAHQKQQHQNTQQSAHQKQQVQKQQQKPQRQPTQPLRLAFSVSWNDAQDTMGKHTKHLMRRTFMLSMMGHRSPIQDNED